MKITIIDTMLLFPEHLQKLRALGDFTYYDSPPKNSEEAYERIKNADIVINFWYKMPKELIEKTKNLKMICVAATGYDWIDTQATKEKGILVCNAPVYTESVAEYTIELILDAIRLSYKTQKEIRQGQWKPDAYKGKELYGKTLGIIGYGRIGQRVGEIAKNGFNMTIVSVTSKSSRDEFEKLLKESDIISINAPKNNTTQGLIGEKEFALMKNGVVIVNTGRGAIIDEHALVQNLKSGKVFAAGLDVLAKEPMDNTTALFSFENVVITPHSAWNTEEAEYNLAQMVVDNIESFLKGKPQNIVS